MTPKKVFRNDSSSCSIPSLKNSRNNSIELQKSRQGLNRSTSNVEIFRSYTSKSILTNGNFDESQELLDTWKIPQTLKERWIALCLFGALACTQCCFWSTWGPIADSAILAFPSWKKSSVALLSNWGCITYLTCCFPCCWFLYTKGIYAPIRFAAILTTIATFARCVSSQEAIFTITAHMAAIFNGISGVIIGPATSLVSAVWFPPGERTTATGISSSFSQLGMALSYLIGPTIVRAPFLNSSTVLNSYVQNISNIREKHAIRRKGFLSAGRYKISNQSSTDPMSFRFQIMFLMRIEFATQLLILLGILWFFPKSPSKDDLSNSSKNELGILNSIWLLLRNKSVWQLCLAGALSQGVTGPWLAMITISFDSTILQDEADRLAFWTIIFGSAFSLTASKVMDIFQGHLKVAIYFLLTISSIMFLWILLLDNQILVFRKEELYTAIILGISTSWSTPALFLELASEIAFPVSEAIVGGFMIFLANLVGTLFYFSYYIPSMGERWSSFCVFTSLIIATILVFYVKDEYHRIKMHNAENP